MTFAGGEGHEMEEAIIVENAQNSTEGIAAEYVYLDRKFGQPGTDWDISAKRTEQQDGRMYDIFYITISRTGESKTLFFDITDFYGTW